MNTKKWVIAFLKRSSLPHANRRYNRFMWRICTDKCCAMKWFCLVNLGISHKALVKPSNRLNYNVSLILFVLTLSMSPEHYFSILVRDCTLCITTNSIVRVLALINFHFVGRLFIAQSAPHKHQLNYKFVCARIPLYPSTFSIVHCPQIYLFGTIFHRSRIVWHGRQI